MEDIKVEPIDMKVIKNSDFLCKSNIMWADPGPPQEINDYEKKLLEGTKSVEQLLEEEKEEIRRIRIKRFSKKQEAIEADKETKEAEEETEEDKEKVKRKRYITKVKLIALDKIGKHPLDNPSTFRLKDKTKVMDMMKQIIDTYTEEQVTQEFFSICDEKLFSPTSDYTNYPVYNA